MVSFTPRPLYPQGKSPWYPLDRRLGGLQSCSGRSGEKNSQLPRESNPRTPIIQPVACRYITELFRLLNECSILAENPGKPKRRWEDNIRMDLKEIGSEGADRISGSEKGPVAGSCEIGNEFSGFIKIGQCLD
jgi:hypothetical protein